MRPLLAGWGMRKNGVPIQRNRPGRVEVTCVGCGVTFESIRSQIERRSGGKFHNRECWKSWRALNKQTRLAKLLATYGLTPTTYQSLYDAQGGVCGICRYSGAVDGPDRLAVDHDHATGRVRGLLCRACNVGLGHFGDDPSILASAVRWLDRPGMAVLRQMARQALAGVGDPSAGEWEEEGVVAFHLRRRLNAAEAASVGQVLDVRGTPEALRRLRPVRHLLPPGWSE